MNFNGFMGNSRIKEYLSGCAKNKTLPQALVITGDKGIGKKTLSAIIAKALVCLGHNERPCGVCGSCRKFDIHIHPDVEIIEDNPKKNEVKYIRDLKPGAYMFPNEDERRVYVFNNAALLTHEAQDALLKILEDPPGFTFFIFLCYNQNSLLETIRSRCTVLELAPLNEEDAAAVIKKHFPEIDTRELNRLTVQSRGIMGRVLNSVDDTIFVSHAKCIAEALSLKDELSILKAMIYVEKLKRNELSTVLSLLKTMLRDALMLISDMDSAIINTDAQKITMSMSNSLSKEQILAAIEIIDASQRSLLQNAGVAHVTGNLACKLAISSK